MTDANVELVARLGNGVTVRGESQIGFSTHAYGSRISGVELRRKDGRRAKIKPLPEVIEAIENADLITLGPGSLYTSIMPNLIVPGVAEAIERAKASVVYINNIMTQPGETDGYDAREHYEAIISHTVPDFIDYCVVNIGEIERSVELRYIEEGASVVRYEKDMFDGLSLHVIESDMVRRDGSGIVRHDTETLADIVMKICEKVV